MLVRLEGDDSIESPTIVIETTKEQYRKWRKEYDAERYKVNNYKPSEVPSDRIHEEIGQLEGGIDPQEYVIGMEIAERIREVYRELDEKDKQILSMSFMASPKMTISKIADELGMSRTTVSRRVKKIQEKILKRL